MVVCCLALAVLVAACGGGDSDTASGGGTKSSKKIDMAAELKKPATITVWAWTPGTDQAVKDFEAAHPNIKVKLQNVGQGPPHYRKLRTVLKSGKGLPDVVHMEFQYIPSFTLTKSLLDMTPYLPENFLSNYPEWVQKQINVQGGIYGVPWDTGPLGFIYRKDLLEKAGVKTPINTWAEFATAAEKYHKANPKSYLVNMPGPRPGSGWACSGRPGRARSTQTPRTSRSTSPIRRSSRSPSSGTSSTPTARSRMTPTSTTPGIRGRRLRSPTSSTTRKAGHAESRIIRVRGGWERSGNLGPATPALHSPRPASSPPIAHATLFARVPSRLVVTSRYRRRRRIERCPAPAARRRDRPAIADSHRRDASQGLGAFVWSGDGWIRWRRNPAIRLVRRVLREPDVLGDPLGINELVPIAVLYMGCNAISRKPMNARTDDPLGVPSLALLPNVALEFGVVILNPPG
jgi:multiple sugar transport system substrate-binding protein